MIPAGWKFSCVRDFRQHKKQLCTEFGGGEKRQCFPGVQRIQWDKQEAEPWKGAALVVPKGRRNPQSHLNANSAEQENDPLCQQHLSPEVLQFPAEFSCLHKQGIYKPWELRASVSLSQMGHGGPVGPKQV